MKFALVLVAALAVVSASALESESEETSLVDRLSRWFSYNIPIPLFAPIRTTTRKPAAVIRTTKKPTTTTRRTTTTTKKPTTTTRRTTTTTTTTTLAPTEAAPVEEVAPEQPEEEQPEEQQEEQQQSEHPSADIMNALQELYNMDGLKDLLPPIEELLNVDPAQQEMWNRPIGDLADPFTLNLLESILQYIMSKEPGTINLDDPIDIMPDGTSA